MKELGGEENSEMEMTATKVEADSKQRQIFTLKNRKVMTLHQLSNEKRLSVEINEIQDAKDV